MNFDFLNNVVVAAPEKAVTTRTSAEKLPEGLALRIFATGKVYPSKELVEKYQLEYVGKDSTEVSNGFDFFKSSDWAGFPVDAPETYIFFAAVPKTAAKVSIFGSCGYNEDGTPKSSILTQGGGKAGKELLATVEEVFGITVEKGSYVDITINSEITIPSNTNVFYLPKLTKKKDNTILNDVIRRDGITVNPISLVNEVVEEEVVADIAEKTDEERLGTFETAEAVNPFENTAPLFPADESTDPGMPEVPEA